MYWILLLTESFPYFFQGGGSCFQTGSCCVAQAHLELITQPTMTSNIFLPQPPKCWDYGREITHPTRVTYYASVRGIVK